MRIGASRIVRRGWQRFEPVFGAAEPASLDRVAARVYRLIEMRGP
jgi:hypothetical protein